MIVQNENSEVGNDQSPFSTALGDLDLEDIRFENWNILVAGLIAANFAAGSNLASVRMFGADARGRPLADFGDNWAATNSRINNVTGVLVTRIHNAHTGSQWSEDFFFPHELLANGIDVTLRGVRLKRA